MSDDVCFLQIAPAISLLHKHLLSMLPLVGEILARSVGLLQNPLLQATTKERLNGQQTI